MIDENIDKATELIVEFEEFRENAYRDEAGVATIGYGTTRLIKIFIGCRI